MSLYFFFGVWSVLASTSCFQVQTVLLLLTPISQTKLDTKEKSFYPRNSKWGLVLSI